MAINHVQAGDHITLIAPGAVASGSGMLVGSIFAVALAAAASGASVESAVVGVWKLPKAAGAVTQGQKLYWDNTAKLVTTTANANILIGAATAAAAGGDSTVTVRLNGTVV